MVLAILFAYLTLQAMWVLIGPSWTFSSLCCLAFAACFPGMVYYYALFPVSLLTFLTIVCLLLYIRRRFLLAGLVGGLCAWAFAIGPLVGVVLLIAALIVDRGPGFWRVVVRSAGVVFAGFAAWLLVNQLWVGGRRAYFRGQSKYANGLHNPISTFVTAFTGGRRRPTNSKIRSGYNYLIPKAQSAFIAAVIGLLVWTLRRRPVSRTEWVIVTYTAVFWLLPLVDGASLSRYRMEALLVPCAVLCTLAAVGGAGGAGRDRRGTCRRPHHALYEIPTHLVRSQGCADQRDTGGDVTARRPCQQAERGVGSRRGASDPRYG